MIFTIFSVPLAEILKVHFPKYVELHNYAARNSYLKKLDNWNTLNRKVLAKLNLKLATNDIENAAKAAPGAIENILFQIKKKVESANSEKVASDPGTANVEESMEGNGKYLIICLKVTNGQIWSRKIEIILTQTF